MGRRQDHAAVLRELPPPEWPAYPGQRSGADLEPVRAVAGMAAPDALIAPGDKYLVLCGVTGLGRLPAEADPGVAWIAREHRGKARMR
ncbi:hypothetical protein AB0M46_31705 [Dactylosporangium sp. NPDC051485]|uniref:hypothetical protein n=1 Tax=Dactylosporangium sp. NPDC051485 TaxID=3154846 RepID=UPI003423B7F2